MSSCKDCKYFSPGDPDFDDFDDLGSCHYPQSPMGELYKDEFNEGRDEPSDLLGLIEEQTFARSDVESLPCFVPISHNS